MWDRKFLQQNMLGEEDQVRKTRKLNNDKKLREEGVKVAAMEEIERYFLKQQEQ